MHKPNCSANTILYTLIMLALHPEVQETLLVEINQICGDKVPTYDDFPNLVYPLCIMFETLRHFPPVVAMPKHSPTDQLLLGKYFVPAGTILNLDAVNVHLDKTYWGDDAEVFNPSRFDGRKDMKKDVRTETGDDAPGVPSEKIRLPERGAFIPFSEGSRSCLGMWLVICGVTVGRKFAQVEFVAILVMITRRWKIELKEGWTREKVWEIIDRSASILTLAPKQNIPLVYRRR